MRKTNFQRTISMTEIDDREDEENDFSQNPERQVGRFLTDEEKEQMRLEDDIDDQREIQRERDFDRIQQSIETDSGNTT